MVGLYPPTTLRYQLKGRSKVPESQSVILIRIKIKGEKVSLVEKSNPRGGARVSLAQPNTQEFSSLYQSHTRDGMGGRGQKYGEHESSQNIIIITQQLDQRESTPSAEEAHWASNAIQCTRAVVVGKTFFSIDFHNKYGGG